MSGPVQTASGVAWGRRTPAEEEAFSGMLACQDDMLETQARQEQGTLGRLFLNGSGCYKFVPAVPLLAPQNDGTEFPHG
jgi:hypothetical protein